MANTAVLVVGCHKTHKLIGLDIQVIIDFRTCMCCSSQQYYHFILMNECVSRIDLLLEGLNSSMKMI